MDDDVEGEVDEGDGEAVVAGGLCGEEALQVQRDVLGGELALADDGLGQDGVCGGHARGDKQAPGKRVARHEPVHEGRKHKPPDHHGKEEQRAQRRPLVVHVPRRELDSDCHELDAEQDPGYLERVVQRVSPHVRVEPPEAVRSDHEPEHRRHRGLTEEELLLHHRRAQGKQDGEKS